MVRPNSEFRPLNSEFPSMPSLYAEIEINAAPNQVWDALVRKENWRYWNTFLYDTDPNLKFVVGREVYLGLQRLEGDEITEFQPVVTVVRPDMCLRWVSRIPGLRSEHSFELRETAPGRTRYLHRDNFSGVLSSVLLPFVRQDERYGLRRMADQLKRYVERGGRPLENYYQRGYNDDGYGNRGYDDRGYGDRGYDDRGYDDRGYSDRRYNDRGYSDQGYNDRGYSDQGYNDPRYNDRGYGDRGYDDRGYNDQGYGDQGYNDGGYPQEDRRPRYPDERPPRDYPAQDYPPRDYPPDYPPDDRPRRGRDRY